MLINLCRECLWIDLFDVWIIFVWINKVSQSNKNLAVLTWYRLAIGSSAIPAAHRYASDTFRRSLCIHDWLFESCWMRRSQIYCRPHAMRPSSSEYNRECLQIQTGARYKPNDSWNSRYIINVIWKLFHIQNRYIYS